jgi:hypothetical protein
MYCNTCIQLCCVPSPKASLGAWYNLNMQVLHKLTPSTKVTSITYDPPNAIPTFIHLKSLMFFCFSLNMQGLQGLFFFPFKFQNRCLYHRGPIWSYYENLVHCHLSFIHIMVGPLYAILAWMWPSNHVHPQLVQLGGLVHSGCIHDYLQPGIGLLHLLHVGYETSILNLLR